MDAYLCGHDHVLEYLRDTPEVRIYGRVYIYSGAFSRSNMCASRRNPMPKSSTHENAHHRSSI